MYGMKNQTWLISMTEDGDHPRGFLVVSNKYYFQKISLSRHVNLSRLPTNPGAFYRELLSDYRCYPV